MFRKVEYDDDQHDTFSVGKPKKDPENDKWCIWLVHLISLPPPVPRPQMATQNFVSAVWKSHFNSEMFNNNQI